MKYAASPLALVMLLAAVLGGTPAAAADPVYPRGIRVGLTPLVGLAPARSFVGFETSDQGVKVLMTELPAAAFGEVETALKANPTGMPVKPEGLETASGPGFYTVENAKDPTGTNVRRYSLIVNGAAGAFSGYVAVQVPENAQKIYTDDAVRQMLASVATRRQVPQDEQLAQMPFAIADLGGFKTVRTLAPGVALLLSDSLEETNIETSPFMVIGSVASAPERAEDRGRFAQQVAATIPGLRDARITMSEPVRIEGMPGYETRIEATSGKDNTKVTVVQWLRFGGGSLAMRIIASSPQGDWAGAFPRFRTVRDSIQPK